MSAVLQRACVARLLGVDDAQQQQQQEEGGAAGVSNPTTSSNSNPTSSSSSVWQRIEIRRTKGSKPFYAGGRARADAPNFNFNVSHEVS